MSTRSSAKFSGLSLLWSSKNEGMAQIGEVQPNISAELKGGLREVTRFVDQYRNRIESLCQEREVAAQDLAVWLESKPIALIDDASRSSDGVPQVEKASVYLRAMCVGMRRLHETSAGTIPRSFTRNVAR